MYKFLFYTISIFPKSLRKKITDSLAKYFLKKYAEIKVEGLDNIPRNNSVIFISNHLSNADGLVFHYLLKEIKKVYFMAGVKLEGELITNLMLDLVPHIKIHPNKPDRKALRTSINTLKDGNSIFIFPEGTRSRTGKMLRGHSGVVLIAKHSEVPIVPIALTGTEKLLPINEDGKMSNEWFNNADVKIKFGKPFTLADLNSDGKVVDEMMLKIANLLPKEYRGYYS